MKETLHPLTRDPLWIFESNEGMKLSMISKFTKENYHEAYSLSVYDNLTDMTMEIFCEVSEIVGIIMSAEHTDMSFIGVNSLTKSYVVGVMFTRGNLKYGIYQYKNGVLHQIGRG